MSPRKTILRRVSSPPPVKGFKPFGGKRQGVNTEGIVLTFEEYEALRLCDYEMHNHHQASVVMGVSRPTFTRIYSSARQKIARAFVEGRKISIEGGKIYFDSDWHVCADCRCIFNNPEKDKAVKYCPLCGSKSVETFSLDEKTDEDSLPRCLDTCFCPACGYEQPHRRGHPCNQEVCPECDSTMKRARPDQCRTKK